MSDEFTTKRYPRSQVEAFGPYGDRGLIYEPYKKPSGYGALWWAVIVIVCIVSAVTIVVGWTPMSPLV